MGSQSLVYFATGIYKMETGQTFVEHVAYKNLLSKLFISTIFSKLSVEIIFQNQVCFNIEGGLFKLIHVDNLNWNVNNVAKKRFFGEDAYGRGL